MLRLGTLLKRTLAPAARCAVPAAGCALALAACGSHHRTPAARTRTNAAKPAATSDHTVYIYSSLPRTGPEAAASAQIELGIKLALREAHSHALKIRIRYRALDDSVVKRTLRGKFPVYKATGWNQSQTVRNAERAARNPETVAYIGDLDSAATMLSLPILNQAGIAQLTPGSGYPGLTDSYKGVTQTGEPSKYYPPPSTRTLLRLIPNDTVQASAALDVLYGNGCRRVAAWAFGTTLETAALLKAVAQTAPKYSNMTYFKPPPMVPAKKLYTYVQGLETAGIHCAVMVGHVTPAAVALTNHLRNDLLPAPTIVGSTGFCSRRWVHGLAKSVVTGLYCTTPLLPVTAGQYPKSRSAVKAFIRLFQRSYHRKPQPYDFYGYVAAELVITALEDLIPHEDPRQEVTSSLFTGVAAAELHLGAFSPDVDGSGDLESSAYGVDSLVNGAPEHYKTVTPSAAHLLTSAG